MADQDQLRPGCGSKAGLLLVFIIAALVAAVAYWAWSKNPPDAPTPSGAANPPVQPSS
jgi:hypothetical protein